MNAAYIELAVACYWLIMILFFMRGGNVKTILLFRVFPACMSAALIVDALCRLGWIINLGDK